MDKLQVFKYEGNGITFATDNGTWVNATEMAKTFGKRPIDWLRINPAMDYIEALFKVREREGKVSVAHFDNDQYYGYVITERGGSNAGTWFHEDVAIEFARWLAPEFGVWCNDRVKELLNGGVKQPQTDEELFALAMSRAMSKISQQRATILRLQNKVEQFRRRDWEYKEQRKAKLLAERNESYVEVEKWLENNCCKGDVFVSFRIIWGLYMRFCKDNGKAIVSSSCLGRIITSKGYDKVRKSSGIFYKIGVEGLKTQKSLFSMSKS